MGVASRQEARRLVSAVGATFPILPPSGLGWSWRSMAAIMRTSRRTSRSGAGSPRILGAAARDRAVAHASAVPLARGRRWRDAMGLSAALPLKTGSVWLNGRSIDFMFRFRPRARRRPSSGRWSPSAKRTKLRRLRLAPESARSDQGTSQGVRRTLGVAPNQRLTPRHRQSTIQSVSTPLAAFTVAAHTNAVAGASSQSAAAVRRDSVRLFAHSETW